ncbi:MAG TPA: hypothetical protein VFS43_10750 [Polyangiaceae bacterium]|nr:hypothetical protein [Polyangiaceae bacterium]
MSGQLTSACPNRLNSLLHDLHPEQLLGVHVGREHDLLANLERLAQIVVAQLADPLSRVFVVE